jgi:hypothetical protein
MMSGHVRLRHAYVSGDAKDANEALVKYGVQALRSAVEESVKCPQIYVNLRSTGRGRR